MFKFAHDPPIDVGAGGSDTQDGMMAMTSVLLAEDDPFIRRVSEVSLKRAGFTVRSVGDGTEALQLLEDGLVDLVILDGLMPTMDGLEACRRLKANPRTAAILMRIIDDTSELKSLEHLGYDQPTVERLTRVLKLPDGLILFTGPTASGKTTGLYASLNQLRDGRTNIVACWILAPTTI